MLFRSLHYCSVNNLPCLFIIENNEFSVYTDLKSRQNRTSIKSKVEGFNVNYELCNNHDFNYLYNIWGESLTRAKNGLGTHVIEIMTHRYREHCGPNFDDNLKYRNKEFLSKWKSIDIINLLVKDLLAVQINSDKVDAINKEIDKTISVSFEKSRNLYIQSKSLIF